MSVTRMFEVTCDAENCVGRFGPGKPPPIRCFGPAEQLHATTFREARAKLAQQGWTFRQGQDLCPAATGLACMECAHRHAGPGGVCVGCPCTRGTGVIHRDVACPTCGALPGRDCTTRAGKRSPSRHAARYRTSDQARTG